MSSMKKILQKNSKKKIQTSSECDSLISIESISKVFIIYVKFIVFRTLLPTITYFL